MYFHHFVIISPWKRARSFIWTNLNPLHPSMLCAKFGWNWLSGSGEEDFRISSIYFFYFVIVSTWKRAGSLPLTNLNPLNPTMNCAEFGWHWLNGSGEEDIWISSMYFHYFVITLHLPLGKGRGPSFEQIWIPFTQGCSVPSLAEIGPVVLEKKIFKFRQFIFTIS